jgi:hypothetical protein
MKGTVSTACHQLQQSLRSCWASGSTIADIVDFLGITKDQVIRLRGVLALPLRLDRSKRAKPPRHRDPTPGEIARACAELRAKHLEQRRNEPKDRVYHREDQVVQFRVELDWLNEDEE